MPSNSNKSSSMPSNPNPRSSEISNPMRRSFTGNPFTKPSIVPNHGAKTPVNSPSDFSRRSSVGIRESGGSLRDFMDDKENGKDQILKPVKVRSPAACSKGSKNFMSPTISASCKVNESPRKKVLVERNETVPSPVDPKIHVRKVTFAEPLEEKRMDPIPDFEEGPRSSLTSEDLSDGSETSETHYMNVPLISKNDTDLLFETVNDVNVNVPLVLEIDIHTGPSFETEPDCVNLDPTFKLSPTATPPVSFKATVLSPFDAPYDPKTNYLSPRPQFLHYKPKPLCRERELEDSFICGSFSDTEVTEDAQSEGSQKESEDVSSDETVKEEGQISEPSPARRTLMPETVEAEEVPKPRFTVSTKAVALILLLAVAFLSISVTDSPVIDQTVFQDFYKVYESSEFSEFARANFDQFTQFAKTNFDEMAQNLQIWFTKLLSSTSEFISDVRGAHNLGKLQYYNLTVQHDYSVVDQYHIFGRGENEIVEIHTPVWNAEENDAASDIDSDEDISAGDYEVYEEQIQQDIGAITGVEKALDAPESEDVLNMVEPEQLAEAGSLEATLAQEAEANLDVENQPSLNSEVAEISIEAYGSDTKHMVEPEQLAEAGSLEATLAQEAEANLDVENQPSLNSEVAEISIEAYGSDTKHMVEPEQLAEAGSLEATLAQEAEANLDVENQPSLNSEVAEISIEAYGSDTKLAQKAEANLNVENQPSFNSEVAEISTETHGSDTKQAQENDAKLDVNKQSDTSLDSDVAAVNDCEAEEKSVSIDATVKGNEERLEAIDVPPQVVLYLLLCAGTVVIAGAAFNWSRKGKRKSKSSMEQPLELQNDSFPSKNKQISLEKPSEPIKMDELEDSSFPSEMSSFQQSSFYSEKLVNEGLRQGIEKKRKNNYRRESLASSSDYSMDSLSPSYGSLTVYEKIPSKLGHGDEETIITPVRRSSRIRNQATSPL